MGDGEALQDDAPRGLLADLWEDYSTDKGVAERSDGLLLHLEDTRLVRGLDYVFTDGSLTWHGAIHVVPGESCYFAHRFRPQCDAKNVGAEWAGLHLGLSLCRPGRDVVVVVDLVSLIHWMRSDMNRGTPMIEAAYHACHDLIDELDLSVTFVHQRGHQGLKNHYAYFNEMADKLCARDVGLIGDISWPPPNLPAPDELA